MKKKELKIIKNNINQKNSNSKNSNRKILSCKRLNSMNNFRNNIINEEIIPLSRNIKSREKVIKESNKFYPLIKKYSFSLTQKMNTNKNEKNISKTKDRIILPNLIPKYPINKNKKKLVFNNNFNNKNEINENKKNKIDINQNDINNNNNLNDIIKFYEEFIELSMSIPNKNLFTSLLNNFNKKYLLHYSTNKTINQIEDIKFKESLKYSFIIIGCLIFLSKDEASHKFNCQRLKDLVEQFIFVSLKNLKINSSIKFKAFINRMKPTKKALNNCVNAIIKLLYNNKNEYNTLKNAFNQFMTNINKFNINDISNLLNNSILYCFNIQNNKNLFLKNNVNSNIRNNKKKNTKLSKINQESKQEEEELIPSAPYIKAKMTKKFCLVLDIDETITHTLRLPSGDYFLVRPGVKEFLEEMAKYFEIVIFTSSPKSYADNILDKIDINNAYFSYRLYRKHVIYENGNSVKKLNMIGRALNKIVFVDNLKSNAKYNPDNLYNIKSWYSDITDTELIMLKNKLKNIATSGNYDNDITKGIYNI